MPEYRRTVRRGQTVVPYGTGAIITINGESFITCNAEKWHDQGIRIREIRLQKMLKRDHFRLAPPAPDDMAPHANMGVPVVRFPDWLFCNRCEGQMTRWSERARANESRTDLPRCARCQGPLTPMRFVMVCAHGHIDDVPWDRLCHHQTDGQCPGGRARLSFQTRGLRAGLEDLSISCRCGAWYPLSNITRVNALQGIIPGCPGRQPWESTGQNCPIFPKVVLRGATNIHFAQTQSSIDIPPYSTASQNTVLTDIIRASSEYSNCQDEDDVLIRSMARRLSRKHIEEFPDATPETVFEILKSQPVPYGDDTTGHNCQSEKELRREEYEVFLAPYETTDPRDTFQKKDVSFSDAHRAGADHQRWNDLVEVVCNLLDRLVLITKLREVSVITDFSRLGSEGSIVAAVQRASGAEVAETVRLVPVARPDLPWLPASQVFGEGIFLTLSVSAVDQWVQNQPLTRDRSARLRRRQETLNSGGPQTSASAPFLLLHTLSHLLIRQLSFTSGYGASSLRERLYCELDEQGHTQQCGILIYTSAGDSEGTLGGLVRQGNPADFIVTLVDALRNSLWCSSDPLCQTSRGQGRNALNLAACHACSLLPETCCSEWNRLLDRVLVVGLTDNPALGYFAPVLSAVAL